MAKQIKASFDFYNFYWLQLGQIKRKLKRWSDWNEIVDCLIDRQLSYFSGLSSLPHPSQLIKDPQELGHKNKDLSQKVMVTSIFHVQELSTIKWQQCMQLLAFEFISILQTINFNSYAEFIGDK